MKAYRIAVPGGGPTIDAGPYATVGAAVEARDTLWGSTTWGGQSLIIVDEAGAAVRPCLWCRGQGNVASEEDGLDRCTHCSGSGIDASAPARVV